MIRAAILVCLMALPAQAQDFRGLLPGMPLSELGPIGEPMASRPARDGRLAMSVYPLPFEQRLEVHHEDGRILVLVTSGDAFTEGFSPPNRQGNSLRSYSTTLGQAVDIAGSEGFILEGRGQFITPTSDRFWWLTYEVPGHPDVVLELRFIEANAPSNADLREDGFYALPASANLTAATLFHADYIARNADLYGTTRRNRPGAAPFTPPLSEAFAPLLTP